MNNKQTVSANKIQDKINSINSIIAGFNTKFILRTNRKSSHWYEYTIYALRNDHKGDIVESKVFSGKPEAVLGYLQGIGDGLVFSRFLVQDEL